MESEDESDFEDFSEPSSSPNLSDDDDGEDDGDAQARMARDAARGIEPYLFEPLADAPVAGAGELAGEAADGEAAAAAGDNINANEDLEARLGNNNWCSCSGGCIPMRTIRESLCCKEVQRVMEKVDEYPEELDCITAHPGFRSVCLDRYVLETAYFQYVQQYGRQARLDASEDEKSRHTAYRQMVRWCWQFLGRRVRVPLPSCAVTMIRNTFQSPEYRGFEDV